MKHLVILILVAMSLSPTWAGEREQARLAELKEKYGELEYNLQFCPAYLSTKKDNARALANRVQGAATAPSIVDIEKDVVMMSIGCGREMRSDVKYVPYKSRRKPSPAASAASSAQVKAP